MNYLNFQLRNFQIESLKLTYENINANRIVNFKWKKNKQKKKGVIVDPLQVMDTKSVNFLSYFLNSEFQSK